MRLFLQILFLLTCLLQASPLLASSNPANQTQTPTFSTQATQKVESEQKTPVFHFARSGIEENISHKTTTHFSTTKQSPTFFKDAFQNFGVLQLDHQLDRSNLKKILKMRPPFGEIISLQQIVKTTIIPILIFPYLSPHVFPTP